MRLRLTSRKLLRSFRRKRPISLQTSAPSKLAIVTSNMSLWFFLVEAVSLSNRSDFRQCMIMSMPLSLIDEAYIYIYIYIYIYV